MEKIFVDTSALYALLSTQDENIKLAVDLWDNAIQRGDTLVTNNYVLVECFALIQRRLGIEFARALQSNLVPFLQVDWIGESEHAISVNNVLVANRRQLSIVDCACFESMRRLGVQKAFTFDEHFREQGFDIIP